MFGPTVAVEVAVVTLVVIVPVVRLSVAGVGVIVVISVVVGPVTV